MQNDALKNQFGWGARSIQRETSKGGKRQLPVRTGLAGDEVDWGGWGGACQGGRSWLGGLVSPPHPAWVSAFSLLLVND